MDKTEIKTEKEFLEALTNVDYESIRMKFPFLKDNMCLGVDMSSPIYTSYYRYCTYIHNKLIKLIHYYVMIKRYSIVLYSHQLSDSLYGFMCDNYIEPLCYNALDLPLTIKDLIYVSLVKLEMIKRDNTDENVLKIEADAKKDTVPNWRNKLKRVEFSNVNDFDVIYNGINQIRFSELADYHGRSFHSIGKSLFLHTIEPVKYTLEQDKDIYYYDSGEPDIIENIIYILEKFIPVVINLYNNWLDYIKNNLIDTN